MKTNTFIFIMVLCALFAGTLISPAINHSQSQSSRVKDTVAFDGSHQAGIATPPQAFCLVASFDLTTTDLHAVRSLFQAWTSAARLLVKTGSVSSTSNVDLVDVDTGISAGYLPSKLTITVGVGPSFFDSRWGLASLRPANLIDLPVFATDKLQPAHSNGDLGVQFCGNDFATTYSAFHTFVKLANGVAGLRWTQWGFRPTKAVTPRPDSRNLQGFHDGTQNVDPSDEDQMNRQVWVGKSDGPGWMVGGTYLVVRKIRILVERWDEVPTLDQERIFGRTKADGSPLNDPSADSHVKLAHGDGTVQIFRRPYSYFDGYNDHEKQIDAGLLFFVWQKNPEKQFVSIQRRLAQYDLLNQYTVTIGSAIFAVFPGLDEQHYYGQQLIEQALKQAPGQIVTIH